MVNYVSAILSPQNAGDDTSLVTPQRSGSFYGATKSRRTSSVSTSGSVGTSCAPKSRRSSKSWRTSSRHISTSSSSPGSRVTSLTPRSRGASFMSKSRGISLIPKLKGSSTPKDAPPGSRSGDPQSANSTPSGSILSPESDVDMELSQANCSSDEQGNKVVYEHVLAVSVHSLNVVAKVNDPVLSNMLKMLVRRADCTDKEVKKLKKNMKTKPHKNVKKDISPVLRVSSQP